MVQYQHLTTGPHPDAHELNPHIETLFPEIQFNVVLQSALPFKKVTAKYFQTAIQLLK
jgi:hypothetical protein